MNHLTKKITTVLMALGLVLGQFSDAVVIHAIENEEPEITETTEQNVAEVEETVSEEAPAEDTEVFVVEEAPQENEVYAAVAEEAPVSEEVTVAEEPVEATPAVEETAPVTPVVEEPVAEPTEEPAPVVQEESPVVEETMAEEPVSEEATEEIEEAPPVIEETETVEEETEEEQVRMPAQNMKASSREMDVFVQIDENVFPEDITMVVREVSADQVKALAEELTSSDEEVVDAIAVDISFYSFASGRREEVQPVNPAGVHVTLTTKRQVEGAAHQVIHIDDNGQPETVATASADGASFDSVGFSVYAIIGTDGKQDSDTTRRTYIFKSEGEELSRQTVKNGDTLYEPAIPVAKEADNYFMGWYVEGSDTPLTFGTISDIADGNDDEEVIVNARFFEEFTVTFYGKAIDGERPILEVETGDTGDTVSTKGIFPQALTGSEELIGWSEDEDATEPQYGLDDTVTIGTEDIDLYPVIRAVRKIEFFGNGGEDRVTFTEPIVVLPGDIATKPETDPERLGYTFKGWYTEPECETLFDWNARIEAGDEPIRLYAGWEPQQVEYEMYIWGEVMDANGNPTAKGTDDHYAVLYTFKSHAEAGSNFTEEEAIKAYTDHQSEIAQVFDYRYYTMATDFVGQTIKGDGSSIFNVYLDLKEFTFSMNPRLTLNTMTIAGVDHATQYRSSNQYVFKAKLGQNLDNLWPSKIVFTGTAANQKFTGWVWTDNTDGSGTADNKGYPKYTTRRHTLTDAMIRKDASGNPLDVTYFMTKYSTSVKTYNTYYYLEDENGSYPSQYDTRFSEIGVTGANNSSVSHKDIAGYVYDRQTSSGTNYSFYYKRATYDILFHNYNVEDPGSASGIKFGANISSYNHTPNHDATGLEDYYEFQGWYTDRQYTNEWTFEGDQATMPAHNLTLYAYWKAKDITITLDYGDGTTSTIQAQAGDTIAEPSAEREGMVFDGWYIGSTRVDFENRVFTDDTTITARWVSGDTYQVRYVDEFPEHPTAEDPHHYRLGSHIIVLAPTDDTHEAGSFHGYRLRGGSASAVYTPGYVLEFDDLSMLDSDGYITFEALHIEAVPQVKIIYHANGGTGAEVETEVQNRNEEYIALPADTFTRTGYTLLGWATSASATVEEFDPGQSISADLNNAEVDDDGVYVSHLYAVWKESSADYTITHHLENLDGTWSVPEGGSYTRTGTVGDTVTAVSREFKGYEYDPSISTTSATLAAEGTVLDLYYKRIDGLKVTYTYEGTVPSGAPALPTDSNTYKFGETVTVADNISADALPAGYSFSGWYTKRVTTTNNQFTMPEFDVVVYGRFTPIADGSNFTITHYGEITDGSTPDATFDGVGYKVLDSYQRSGTAGETGTAQFLTRFTGYTADTTNANNITSGTITGNGSLKLQLFYTANQNDVVYHYIGTVPSGAPAVPATTQHKYGEKVDFEEKPTLAGYDFNGWRKPDGSDLVVDGDTFTMPNRAVEIVGSFTPRSDTKYRVQHYLETLDGGWEIGEEYENTATTDTTYYAIPHTFRGFTFDETVPGTVIEGTVSAEEELVLKLYYRRNGGFNVTYEYDETAPANAPAVPVDSNEYKYGETVTVADDVTPPAGYDFLGWHTVEITVKDDGTFEMPNRNARIIGSFAPRNDTAYKIGYYYQNLDGTYPDTASEYGEGRGVTGTTVTVTTPDNPTGYTFDEDAGNVMSVVIAGDGSSEIKLYFKRNTWNIKYQWEGMEEGVTYPDVPVDTEDHMYGSTAQWVDPNSVVAPEGYEFKGWHTRAGSSIVVDDEGKFTMPDREVVFIGSFAPKEGGATFKVRHWGEKADDSGEFELLDEYERTGTIGASPTIEPHTFTGFKFDPDNPNNVTTGPISDAHDTVYKLYYNRLEYDVVYNWKGVIVDGAPDLPATVKHKNGSKVILDEGYDPEEIPVGYEFLNWQTAENSDIVVEYDSATGERYFTMPNRVVNLYGQLVPATDTAYKVEHYVEKANEEGYELKETEELEGTTDTTVSAKVKDYTGFSQNMNKVDKISGKVAGDGSLVLEVYYDRNIHAVVYHYDTAVPEGASALPEDSSAKYGETITIADQPTVPAGYTFDGWKYKGTIVTSMEMPNDSIELIGSFAAKSDTKYTIEYYGEPLTGSEYELLSKDETHTGTTGSTVTAPVLTFDGFTYDSTNPENNLEDTIDGNGTTVLKVYYKRNTYKLSYDYEGYVPTTANPTQANLPKDVEYKYGQEVTPEDAAKATGYDFSGWDLSSLTEKEGKYYMPAEDETVIGSFTAIPEGVQYIVRHYGEALASDTNTVDFGGKAYVLLHEDKLPGTAHTETTESKDTFAGYEYSDSATRAANPDLTVNNGQITGTITALPPLIMNFLYTRNTYTVTYAYEGTVPAGAPEVPAVQEHAFGETVTVEDDKSLAGYDFISWHTLSNPASGDHIDIVNDEFVMPARNVTIVGQFVPRDDTKFRVTHYLEQLDGSFAVPQKDGDNDPYYDYEKQGTTGDTYTARALTLAGYTFDSTMDGTKQSGTITAGDEELKLKLYYTRKSFKVSYEVTNPPTGYDVPEESQHKFEEEVTIEPEGDVPGYTFNGWNVDASDIDPTADSFTMPANDVKFTGSFTPNEDTKYTVQYLVEGLEDPTQYELIEKEELTGTTGTQVTAEVKDYSAKGFVQDTTKTSEMTDFIAGDESTVLKVYYKRRSFNVTYSYENTPAGASPLPATKSYQAGATVDLEPDATAPGYEFLGWHTLEHPETGEHIDVSGGSFIMPGRNVSIRGSFKANEDTPYTIEFYYQKDGDFSDTPDKSETRTGTTDTKAEATDADKQSEKEGYALSESNSVLSGTITGDGKLTLRLYFKEDKNNNGTPDDEEEYTVLYKQGDHGTFTEDEADATKFEHLMLVDETPEYAGELDDFDKPEGEADWTFVGWEPEYVDTIKAEDSDENSVIEYVAQWKEDKNNNGTPDDEEEFTVVYKKGDHGTFAEDTDDATKFSGLSLDDETPEYAGEKDSHDKPQGETDWTFAGWEPEVAGTIDAGDADDDNVITYVATWAEDKNNNGTPDDEEEFTVIYTNGEHGDFTEDVEDETKFSGLVLDDETPEYEGELDDYNKPKGETNWTFIGWEPSYKQTVDAADADENSVIEYVAQWKEDKNNNGTPDDEEEFTVVYKKGDHGTFTEDTANATKFEGLSVDDETPEYAGEKDSHDKPQGEENWTFVGWEPEVADTVKAEDADEDSVIEYVAQWKEDKNNNGTPDDEEEFTVVYKKGDHGTFTEDTANATKFEGLSVDDETPEYAGEKDSHDKPQGETDWTFVGWEPEVADTVKAEDADENSVIEYVAQWKEDKNNNGTPDDEEEFTVVYKKGDHGTFAEDTADATKFAGLSLDDETPEYAGEKDSHDKPEGEADWTFVGWEPEYVDTIKAEDSDENSVIEYVAQWKEDKNNNGTPDDEEEFTVVYKKGDHGTFAEDTDDATKFSGLSLDDETPEYAGEKDSHDKPQGETDWTFAGWEPEVADTVKAEDAAKDSTITYTATWKEDKNNNGTPDDEEEFTVSYKKGDHGTFTEDSDNATKFSGLGLNDETPEYAGEKDSYDKPQGEENWTFVGWEPEVADTIKAEDSDTDSLVTYKALWKEDKNNNGTPDDEEEFTVVYKKGDHGTFAEDADDATKFAGLSLDDETPEYAGEKDSHDKPQGETDWTFVGWEPEIADTVKAEDADKDSTITYTATWKEDKNNNGIPDEEEYRTITYKDGADGQVFEDKVFDKALDTLDTPTVDDPTRKDYVFAGWTPEVSPKVNGDATYTATWKEDKNNNGIPDEEEYRTITYKDGADGQVFEDKVFDKALDTLDTPTVDDPTRKDYVFAGWTPEVSPKVNGDATYTATWKEDKNNNGIPDEEEYRTITYKDGADGQAFEDKVFDKALDTLDTPTVDEPTRKDYIFAGWTPEVSPKVNGDATYTATWKEDKNNNGIPDDEEEYTIIFDPNGGNWDGSTDNRVTTYKYDTDITITDAPTRDGYKFLYWKGSEYQPGEKYTVVENHTFVAQWEKKDTPSDGKGTPANVTPKQPGRTCQDDGYPAGYYWSDAEQKCLPGNGAAGNGNGRVMTPYTADNTNLSMYIGLLLFALATALFSKKTLQSNK